MGLHQFCLGHHRDASKKLLKSCIGQHQVITGGYRDPNLADGAYLMAQDGVALPDTLYMLLSARTHLRVVLKTLLGRYHPTANLMDVFSKSIVKRKT